VIALLAAVALVAAPQPVPFEALSVGIDRRILTVAYESGPCWAGGPTELRLEQNDATIRLTVLGERLEGCAEPPAYRRLAVRLRRPLAGRRIEGAARIAGAPDSLRRRTAPRVVDFDAADARRTLALQSLRTRRLGRTGGTVSFQSPLAGRRAGGLVRLTVGRELFRARALRHCLEHAGIPTLVRPVRAKELAPAVRRSIRRIGGVFERERHVALGWYAKPAPDPRERTQRCVYGPLARPRT